MYDTAFQKKYTVKFYPSGKVIFDDIVCTCGFLYLLLYSSL
jgi:hypothetical protein